LLEAGLDVDITLKRLDLTQLFISLCSDPSGTAIQLIDKNASLERSGTTALRIAAGAGLQDVVTHLVRNKGLDINAVDRRGFTSLVYAILLRKVGRHTMISLLLRLGANHDMTCFTTLIYPRGICL